MKKLITIQVIFTVAFFLTVAFWAPCVEAGTSTIATFSDPSPNYSEPIFMIDLLNDVVDAGWGDDKIGLTLEFTQNLFSPSSKVGFDNAWFEMSQLQILSTVGMYGHVVSQTGLGVINYYADGTATNPLMTIEFDSSRISHYSVGADEMFLADNVTITGSMITGTLSEEQFTFAFANLERLPGSNDWKDGFTATAAFTSSAVPEPATLCLLGLGGLLLRRRKD